MLHINGLHKSYTDASEERTILKDLSLSVLQGESLSIQGASGCGKSTLLHLIGALDKPDSGEIILRYDDQHIDITQFTSTQADYFRQKDVGMIFQKFNLIDCISVKDNVYLPARINESKQQNIDHAYIDSLLENLGVSQHINKLPNQLSGGEQQRVAIARALSHKPKLLLADEPTGNLDEDNSGKVSQLLVDTCRAHNTLLIMVTHSQQVAALTQRKLRLSNGNIFNCGDEDLK